MRELGNVLVTGGASGLGAAVVAAVAERGGTPLVLDRKAPADPVKYQLVDLADGRAAERAARQLADCAGGLDGVFTAAGIEPCGQLDSVLAAAGARAGQVHLLAT